MDNIELKPDYTLANCCSPTQNDVILGYYSHDNIIKVHCIGCTNISNVEKERLVNLNWDEILVSSIKFKPENDYEELDNLDFGILQHHLDFGVDYSLVVARKLNISKQEAFDRHKKLKNMNLLSRVDAAMIQYRKGIVKNKWIKHRNHTYYDLTEKGKNYLKYYLSE